MLTLTCGKFVFKSPEKRLLVPIPAMRPLPDLRVSFFEDFLMLDCLLDLWMGDLGGKYELLL